MFDEIIKTSGHLVCSLDLFLTSVITEQLSSAARRVVSVVSSVTGIQKNSPKPWVQLYSTEPVVSEENILNESLMLSRSKFPIKPADLVQRCKNIVHQQFGAKQPDLLSEDFQFIFPVVGPLTKKEFTAAFSSFKVEEAFTGSYNYFGFHVDPTEPNRVWFFSRGVLTHSGVLLFGAMKIQPTGKTVVGPPQVLSMSFNTEGLCYKFTGGYSVDRTVGNTGGLGGVFGLIHAIGGSLPFPEGQPWQPSLNYELFNNHVPSLAKIWRGGQ